MLVNKYYATSKLIKKKHLNLIINHYYKEGQNTATEQIANLETLIQNSAGVSLQTSL